MTASVETTTAATQASTTGTTPVVEAGEYVVRLHPTALEVGPNVRSEVDTESPAFRNMVASIIEHGVLMPILARRDGDHTVVIDGQVRTLAAIEAGVDSVRVLIVPTASKAKDREIERLTQQVVANDRRIGLTEGQRAKAVTDMLELGLSVPKIAKAVQVKRETVKAAGAAGRSQTAIGALDAGQLTLDQAAIVAVFDAEGDTAAVEKLLGVARYDFRWTAQRLLEDRAVRKARAAAGAPYVEQGLTVLEEEPAYGGPYLRADDLVTVDGDAVTDAVIDGAAGHWAVWLSKEDQFTLTATGAVIEEDSIDWDTQDDPEATPDEGLHHHKDITAAEVWVPEYFTADPDAAGVKPGPILAAALAEPAENVDPADAEAVARAAEQKRLAAEAAAKEAERAARRRTKALNVASLAATVVRKEFVSKFLTRKTLPKGAAKWITDTLVDEPGLLTQNKASQYLAELLGVSVAEPTTSLYGDWKERAARDALAPVIDKASDSRAQVIALAQILAAYEARMSGTGKDWWKRVGGSNQDNYLGLLAEQGYELIPVEKVAAGTMTPEQAYDALSEESVTD
ncbi:ParB/RepB/Spo0J family partition protein [Rhodococcoides navarretei]|uniref:ParB N-terminal domain-containing protein n=1 Tax=Rhodococcus navarretei TaxID=3128981 RepID=A0ABU9D3J3_9NOCA